MTDTITIELPREVAEAIVEPVTAKSLEFEFFGAESLVVAVQEALANPTRSDESELRGSVTIEEKEDGDWLCFSPPEGSFVMVLLDGIGGPIIQRSIRATLADHQIDSERDARAEREKLQFLNPAGLHYHQGSGRLSFNGVGFKGACIDVGDMNGRTEDLVTDLIERTEVAVASAWSAGYDSGQKRLANSTRSDEELRSAAVDVLRRLAANSDARSDLTKRENDAIIAGRGTEDFADEWLALRDEAKELAQESRDLLSALSQTPGGRKGDGEGDGLEVAAERLPDATDQSIPSGSPEADEPELDFVDHDPVCRKCGEYLSDCGGHA